LCTGKIYYELMEQKEKDQANDVAIVRLEQIYPLPVKQLEKVFSKYKKASEYIWVQEEPENMGAWSFLLRKLKSVKLNVICRPESASPATGSHHAHDREQRELIMRVFEKVEA
jgi:2-oxoglutarate dehydrogenase E1 component